MPIYEYQARKKSESCSHCREPFEHFHKAMEEPLEACPHCGAPLEKLISAPSIGLSKTGLDSRAKNAGFHKLKKLGKGEYEKKY
jgi:putative FmdB family regulatory protein